jgi:hypothetical protein
VTCDGTVPLRSGGGSPASAAVLVVDVELDAAADCVLELADDRGRW